MTLLEEFKKTQHWIEHHHPHSPGSPTLTTSGVSVLYATGAALDDVSFKLMPGERVAVVGPNGAGKSTLLKVVAGVLTPTRGQVHVYGHEPGGHICIAYLPQRSLVDWRFPVTVADVVMMGRIGKLGLFHNPAGKDWKIVEQCLDTVGLAHLAKRQIGELSGGQQQRMFIARSLAQEAELMLMDEPLAGLDIASQEDIFSILDVLRHQGVTILLALHDLQIASQRFDHVMLLNRRLIGFGHPSEVFSNQNLIAAYGGHLHLVSTQEGTLAVENGCCDQGEFHQ